MLMDFLVSLVMTLVVGPLQSEIADVLAASAVPAALVSEVTGCLQSEGPEIVDRILADPWMGISTAVSVAAGFVEPSAAVADLAPGCSSAFDRALAAAGSSGA